jgi:CBS domain-containing protein
MKTIKEIMVDTPHHCFKHETLKNISAKMHTANIGSVPIVDENKKVIGIITDRDIALALSRLNIPLGELKAQDVMTTKVHTIRPDDNVATALRIMRTRKVGRLPVVDNELKLKGMVSLNRILRNSHGSDESNELEYAGEENILNTLHSISERNTNGR